MKITHVMRDGTVLDNIDNLVIPSTLIDFYDIIRVMAERCM